MAKFESTRTYLLKFEEEEYRGLEIRARGISIANLLNMTRWASEIETTEKSGSAENIEMIERLMGLFSDCLIDWNITNNDADVPATYAGVMTQEMPFMLRVIKSFMASVGGVPAPLDQQFSDGGQSEEQLMIPMEVASVSLSS